MKCAYTLILALGIIYLSSCNNNSSNTTVTPADSASTGGNFQVAFTTISNANESFYVNDYTLNGVAQVVLYANIMYSNSDSLWHLNLQLIDEKMKRVSVIYSGVNPLDTGTYTSNNSTSTLTDYTNGENVTYSITKGSTVYITQATYPIQGTFYFNLNRNYYTTPATGSFSIN